MIRLYHVPQSRSARILWLLEELGLEYEIESLSMQDGSMKRPEYLAVHPLGRVPALRDGEVTLFESGAIAQYLLEKYGQGRLEPAADSPERPAFLQWLHWSEATLMIPVSEYIRFGVRPPEPERNPAAAEIARGRAHEALRALDAALAGREFLLESGFSAADVMMSAGVRIARILGLLPEDSANLAAYLDRLEQRPAYPRAHQA